MGSATEETAVRGALDRLASQWELPLDQDRSDRLLQFGALLMQWNAQINLTGARSLDSLVSEHFPDSFALAAALAEPAEVVDVGSGGGLPGLPLAILRPGLRLTLVEPLSKKVAFLRTAVRELGLAAAVTVRSGRADDLEGGSFDVALSRATFPPAEWVSVARRLVRKAGRIFVLTVPETDVPGQRVAYLDGRRTLIELRSEDCST